MMEKVKLNLLQAKNPINVHSLLKIDNNMPKPDEIDVFELVMNQPRTKYHDKLTPTQQKTLKSFYKIDKIRNLTNITIGNQLNQMAKLGVDTKKEYKDMTKKDVNDWLNRNIKPSSRQVYQRNFNKFFKWLGKNPKKWFIKIENAGSKVIEPSNLWTPEEVESLIKVYPDFQHKAVVATLYDSEARVSELCSVNISDVEFVAGNATIFIRESKTQKRRVELLFASKELLNWYNLRKAQCKSLDEPLWLSKCNRNRNQRLTPGGVTEILKYGCKLLGTKKRLTPHLLRHSMTSYLRSRNSDAHHPGDSLRCPGCSSHPFLRAEDPRGGC
jgi:site-specific recombinase XerD